MELFVVSRSRQADSMRTVSTWSAAVIPTCALKSRVNWRSERLTCRASAGTERSSVRWSRNQESRSRTGRLSAVCPARINENWACPPDRLEVDDELSGDSCGGRAAVVFGDQRQGEIDAGGDAWRGPDVAVLHIDGVGVDGHVGIGDRQVVALGPVGGSSSTLEKASRSEDERAGAHRGDPACVQGEAVHVLEKVVVKDGGANTGASGDHQRVDRAGDRSDRGGGELEPATGANRSAADGNDFGLVLSALDVPGRAREDLQGPGHVEDLGRVEGRDDHADWAHGLSIRSA